VSVPLPSRRRCYFRRVWAGNCILLCMPFTRPLALAARDSTDTGHEDRKPSGRHGGPCIAPFERGTQWKALGGMATAGTSNTFLVSGPYEQAVGRIKRALSRQGLEILRECNLGSRLVRHPAGEAPKCRLMYVAPPGLLARAMAAHASSALWLPVPLVVTDQIGHTRILVPVESIVRDRATLLGLLASVQDLYQRVTAALQSAGCNGPA
jgi:uncharacterized protein (DUF302 family)